MKLVHAKSERQFFFVTLASAERRTVFSRLASESGRPALLGIGELVSAALRAVHRVWPAVTVSDYVIMPDHLHFLLIVNYDLNRSISPLFVAHRVADAVELAVARGLEASPPRPLCLPSRDKGAVPRRRQPRNRRRTDAHPFAVPRHSRHLVGQNEAQSVGRPCISPQLPGHERYRGQALPPLGDGRLCAEAAILV